MTAPKIYRYNDDNAPVFSGSPGAVIALLKACLVDGYGDKTPAGWSMPYSNAEGTLAVFRNNRETGASGFHLQCDNRTRPHTFLQGYEDMTDEATGVKPFSNSSPRVLASNDLTPRPWILFADDRFFILVPWHTTTVAAFGASLENAAAMTTVSFPVLFGDGVPLFPDDAYFCLLFCDGQVVNRTYSLSTGLASVANSTYQFAARNLAGADAVTPCRLIVGGGPLYDAGEGVTHHDNLPARVPGHEIVSRPYVNDGTAYSMRGYVPGLWHSCHKYTDFVQFEVFDVGAHRFMVVKFAGFIGSQRNHILVDISEHWRP